MESLRRSMENPNTINPISAGNVNDRGKINPHIVILIPCYNEEPSIAKVINDFQNELPEAEVIVIDNASTDQTRLKAIEAGARVLTEKRRGKGFAVQTMFQKIEADIYIMVDGDDTYPAERVRALIEPVLKDDADMVIGSRIVGASKTGFKLPNFIGNKFFLYLINMIFHARLTDILSGYRCMNRNLLKSLPLFDRGFGIEAEMTIKALERGFRLVDVPVDLRPRGTGSFSKIRVIQDGFRILAIIFVLFRDYKPLTFFGSLGLITIFLGCIPGIHAINSFTQQNAVIHVPSIIIAISLAFLGMLFIAIGLILHTINRRFQEMEYFMRIKDNIPTRRD